MGWLYLVDGLTSKTLLYQFEVRLDGEKSIQQGVARWDGRVI